MSDAIDTGFGDVLAGNVYKAPDEDPSPPVTVTVTAPEAEQPVDTTLTDAGKQAALALLAMPPLTAAELAQLAREMAMNIRPQDVVLHEFKLTTAQYEYLEKNHEFYSTAYKQACIEWHAPMSTQERIKIEAAAILEDSLIGLGARMRNKAEGLPGVVEVAKLFAKVAGVGEREAGAAPSGERFVINIDLGADKTITLSTQAPAAAPAAQRSQLSLPAHAEPEGD